MKLCTSSVQFSNLIDIILKDDCKKFNFCCPKNLEGQIDKMPFLNFCISSNSIQIIKGLLKNKELLKTAVINITTIKCLLKNKVFTLKEKTYIYQKIIKYLKNIKDKFLLNLIIKYDIKCISWLNKSKKLNKNDFALLFDNNINIYNISFCRRKNIPIIPLLFKKRKSNIINYEDYTDLFTEKELILLVNKCLEINKDNDLNLNLLDSAIKILINNQSLINKIDINALSERKLVNDEFFSFLNIDIDKILMYKKFSKPIYRNKVKKI